VAVPTARLVVKTSSFGDEATVALTQARFERRGMPMDRVEFLPTQTTQQEHLDSYRHIDIALDTFPYCGTTTTCEALASGVPVISLVGNHHAARVGLSLLAAAGHSEWAAASPDRFVHAATHLAGDLSRLATLRASLRAELSQSTLCNAAAFAAKIERIYRDAWARYCRR
jgi:predicted O-linked N-acetylglucosamine transferase (SPINDLY family)